MDVSGLSLARVGQKPATEELVWVPWVQVREQAAERSDVGRNNVETLLVAAALCDTALLWPSISKDPSA